MSSRRSPKRGQVHGDHLEPVEQVLAEAAVGDPLLEGLVGRGDDAHVGADGALPPDPVELLLLQHPQQVHLGFEGDVADLVEKDGAPGGQFELPLLHLQGSGERPLLVSEQLALDQVHRQGAAVDPDEGAGAARAAVVDRPGNQLLPGPALPVNQHGGVDDGHLLHSRQDLGDLPRPPDDFAVAILDLLAQVLVLLPEPVALAAVGAVVQNPLHLEPQRFHGKRLGDEIDGADLHGAHRDLDGAVSGDDDDVGVGEVPSDRLEELQPVHFRHLEVGDHQVESRLPRQYQQGFGPAGCLDRVASHALDHQGDAGAHGLVVVDDQYPAHACTSLLRRALRAAGRWRVTVVPLPGSLAMSMRPRFFSTAWRAIAIPRPDPFSLVVKKGSNRRA